MDEQNTLSKQEFWDALTKEVPSCGNCAHNKDLPAFNMCQRCTRSVFGPSPYYSGYEIGDFWERQEE